MRFLSAGWGSQVIPWAHNPKISSSNLLPATLEFGDPFKFLRKLIFLVDCI